MTSSYILIYSGGLDSTVLLYHLRASGSLVDCLSFDYGQKHRREISSARFLCDSLGIPHSTVDISALNTLFGKSALTDQSTPVPHGHYTDETMKSTIVPNRNMIMIAAGIACAISRGADAVAYGAHCGDHAIYPDCRPEFGETLNQAAQLCDWRPIRVVFPFISMSKAEIVKRGTELRVPFNQTWSCYEGGKAHCGRCGTCVERIEAFHEAAIADPTIYAEER